MSLASSGGGGANLEAALRTCKVETGWANKVQSDRFLNPNNAVCVLWNGVDTAGRSACPDSFMTKRAGCNSAEDRVVVENNVTRPQYMAMINLNAAGIASPIYENTLPYQEEGDRNRSLLSMLPSENSLGVTGQFGYGGGYSQTYPGCKGMGKSGEPVYERVYPGRSQVANRAVAARKTQGLQNYFQSAQNRRASGF